jgi:hypothetical protein
MGRFAVTQPGLLRKVLETFGALDRIRWSYSPNYNLVNYCDDAISADEKLLTHWLSYIMDRQMPFMRVWEVGGYLVSHLVRTFEQSKTSVSCLVRDYVMTEERATGTGIALQCPAEGANRRLALAGIRGNHVRFASRYVPEDTFLIFRTLAILDQVSHRSFAGFLAIFLSERSKMPDAIHDLAVALDGLTYSAGSTISASTLSGKLEQLPSLVAADVTAIRSQPAEWLAGRKRAFRPFGKKRLWCSLRDYLKSPEFNTYFVQSLKDIGRGDAERWHRENPDLGRALDVLELPGDVWNNNENFANGLFMPNIQGKPGTWDMPRTVREIYKLLGNDLRGRFYPEQLDVTFDFVPRMCDRQMCRVCPFGGGVGQLCHRQSGLLCPVPLVSCGYQHACAPGCCDFEKDSARGVCQHWQALVAEASPSP